MSGAADIEDRNVPPSEVVVLSNRPRTDCILRMKRHLIGFHQDELGEWVAELRCNHNQHIRRHFQMRPWVTNEQGRQQQLGAELECCKCDDEPDYLRENRTLMRRYYGELWNQPVLTATDKNGRSACRYFPPRTVFILWAPSRIESDVTWL